MALEVVQLASGIGIVAAFAALQLGLVDRRDPSYLIANLVCAGGLTVCAVLLAEPGFVISNGFWTLVAAAGLLSLARRGRSPPDAWGQAPPRPRARVRSVPSA